MYINCMTAGIAAPLFGIYFLYCFFFHFFFMAMGYTYNTYNFYTGLLNTVEIVKLYTTNLLLTCSTKKASNQS